MKPLEDALREALRRQDPGPDFTAQVLARTAAAPVPARREARGWWQALTVSFAVGRMRWAMAGAVACVLLVAGSVGYRERQARIEGQAAKQQLVLALRIAGTKLNLAREKLQELNDRGE
jgi:hypothetical protein